MDCERIEPLLSAHLDGELDQAEARAVRRHLLREGAGEEGSGCERCAPRLETLRAARAAMRDLRPGPSGRGLDRVLERIRGERRPAAPAPVIPLPRQPRSEPRPDPRSGRRLTAGVAAGLVAAALVAAVMIAPHLGREGADTPGTEAPSAPVSGVPAAPASAADEGPPACLRPEECGADAHVLWPAVPI